jgi:hypothetical protein
MKTNPNKYSSNVVFTNDENNDLRVENRDVSGKKSELIVKVLQDDHLTHLKGLVASSKLSKISSKDYDTKAFIETWFASLRSTESTIKG